MATKTASRQELPRPVPQSVRRQMEKLSSPPLEFIEFLFTINSYTKSRNAHAEEGRLCMGSQDPTSRLYTYCRYEEQGCRLRVTHLMTDVVEKHEETCSYRPSDPRRPMTTAMKRKRHQITEENEGPARSAKRMTIMSANRLETPPITLTTSAPALASPASTESLLKSPAPKMLGYPKVGSQGAFDDHYFGPQDAFDDYHFGSSGAFDDDQFRSPGAFDDFQFGSPDVGNHYGLDHQVPWRINYSGHRV